MCAHDRSFLPSVVKFQDRGKMTIMHSAMFEFGRILFSTVRESLNYTAYMQKGANLFTHIHHSTMHNAELQHVFKSSILSLPYASNEDPLELDESVVSKVYNTIVEKMMHTMNNDFLISLKLLDSIDANKGTGANLLLRDKLKAAAADAQSHVPKL